MHISARVLNLQLMNRHCTAGRFGNHSVEKVVEQHVVAHRSATVGRCSVTFRGDLVAISCPQAKATVPTWTQRFAYNRQLARHQQRAPMDYL